MCLIFCFPNKNRVAMVPAYTRQFVLQKPMKREFIFCRNSAEYLIFCRNLVDLQNSAEDRWLTRQLENSDLEKYSCKIYQQGHQRHNHFYSCRNHDFEWFWNSAELCRILQNRGSESACWRANGGLTPKCFRCVFFFVS